MTKNKLKCLEGKLARYREKVSPETADRVEGDFCITTKRISERDRRAAEKLPALFGLRPKLPAV